MTGRIDGAIDRLPTPAEFDHIIAEAKRLVPRAHAWSPYGMATAATIDGTADAPAVVDHHGGSDMLTAVRLRKRCECARCRTDLPAGADAFRLMTFTTQRSDRFCGGCRSVMLALGRLPGSDSERRLQRTGATVALRNMGFRR